MLFKEIQIPTVKGPVNARFLPPMVGEKKSAVIYAGGIGGGFDSPAQNVYTRLAAALAPRGIAGLWLKYRDARNLDEATFDLMSAIDLLDRLGMEDLGLVGHSFGGAVVIRAAVPFAQVKTVVTLATQTQGADVISKLAPRSVFLIHGTADKILPQECSKMAYGWAGQPKRLELIENGSHGLDESSDQVFRLTFDWLESHLF